MGLGEDPEYQGMLIADAKAVIDPLQVGLDGAGLDAQATGNRLLLLVPQDQLDNLFFPRSQVQLAADRSPKVREHRQGREVVAFEGVRLIHQRPRKKRERRTKAAPRTPAKGRTERTLADAPCGARLKALLLYMKLGGFLGSSDLTLARQFNCRPRRVAPKAQE